MNVLTGYSKSTLSDNYLLSAAGGHIPLGNSSGDVPLSNNTLNTDLFAEKAALDGDGRTITTTYALKTELPNVFSKAITSGFTTAFRTQAFGSSDSSLNYGVISTIRCENANVLNAPQYGSGLAFGKGDTHSFLYTNYSLAEAYIGGGNADKLNWVKKLAFASGTSSQFIKGDGSLDSNSYATTSSLGNYLPLSGGIMTGHIKLTTGSSSIRNHSDMVLLAHSNSSSYSGVTDGTNTVVLGNATYNTLIRSNNTDLLHHKAGTNHVILDAANYNTYTVQKVSGCTTTTNNYVKLGTLPTSTNSTYDSFVIQGSVGGFTSSTKSHIDISVSRRNGITYRGFLQHIHTTDWDLGVNNAGEIFLILPGNYCAWSLSLHTIQGTIDYQTSATPTDTNWTLLSESTSILKFSKEGVVEKADSVAWSGITNKPTSFTPSDHASSLVTSLSGYSKATSASDLATTDTLNAALGKLEYKSDYAYDWITNVAATDTDEYINKWSEIVGFLDSVKEGTDILDEFVTRKTTQTITGAKTFSGGVTLSCGLNIIGTNPITWNDGTYHQRIQTTDDSNTNTNLFEFQQSKDTGATWESLFTIKDNGHVVAAKFITTGGTSSLFVKGDGSLDSNSYLKFNGGYFIPTTECAISDVLAVTGYNSITKSAWDYGGNGYLPTKDDYDDKKSVAKYGNIDLAGATVLTVGNSNQHTLLYITPPTSSGTSDFTTNDILLYLNHGSDYLPGWTRILTDRTIGAYAMQHKKIVLENNLTIDADTLTDPLTLYYPSGDLNSKTNITWNNFPDQDPPAGGFSLLNILEGGYKRQIYGHYSRNTLYVRCNSYNGSGVVWSEWKLLAGMSDIPTKLSLLTNDSNYATVSSTLGKSSTSIPNGSIVKVTVPSDSHYLITLRGTQGQRCALLYVSGYGSGGTSTRLTVRVVYSHTNFEYYYNEESDSIGGIYVKNAFTGSAQNDTICVTSLNKSDIPTLTTVTTIPTGANKINSAECNLLTVDTADNYFVRNTGSLKNPNALTIFGINYDGSVAQTITANTMISTLLTGTSDVTDYTEILTSYASDNGFVDPNAPNTVYKRSAIKVYNYIKGKLDSVYQPKGSYLTSRGYIGTTAVQETSAILALTGISGITFSGGNEYFDQYGNFHFGTAGTTWSVYHNDASVLLKLTKSTGLVEAKSFKVTGGTYSQFLKADGSVDSNTYLTASSSIPDTSITWSSTGLSGLTGPVSTALCGPLKGNRFAGIKAEAVSIEYSRDAGATWYDYEAAGDYFNSLKRYFFNLFSASFILGKNSDNTTSNDNYRLRVTVDCNIGQVYSELKKAVLYVTTNNSNNCTVTVLTSNNNTTYTDRGTYYLNGWSGYNEIPLVGITADPSARGGAYSRYIRFLFSAKYVASDSAYAKGLTIMGIEVFGGVGWTTPNNHIAKYGRPYTFDYLGLTLFYNTVYPAANNSYNLGTPERKWYAIYASSFIGNVTGNITGSATSVIDFGNGTSAIKIGYAGAALTTTEYFAAYSTTSDGTRCIKDISVASVKTVLNVPDNTTAHISAKALGSDLRYIDKTTDLNTLSYGMYASYNNYDYTNGPKQNFGLMVMRINSGYTGLLAFGYGSSNLMYRSKSWTSDGSSTWKEWLTIAYMTDLPTKVSQLTNDSNYVTKESILDWKGFTQRTSNCSWGTLTSVKGYTPIFWLDSVNGGGVAFSDYNGKTYLQIDGDYYANEGANLVLHTANYNSYAPTLTGTGASGTWDISITGYATRASVLQYVTGEGTTQSNGYYEVSNLIELVQDNQATYIITTRANENYYMSFSTDDAKYIAPEITRMHNTYTKITAFAWKDGVLYILARPYNNNIKITCVSNGKIITPTISKSTAEKFNAATRIVIKDNINSSNYNLYSPTLTGTGASGTWSINVSGSSNSASYANRLTEYHNLDRQHDLDVIEPWGMPLGIMIRFKNNIGANMPGSQWNTIISMNGYTGASSSGAGYRHEFLFSDSLNHNDGTFYVRNGVNDLWNEWVKVVTAKNYKDAIPTVTTSAAGLMSTSDKTKLDAVDSTYLKLTGGQISSSATTPLSINSTSGTESGLRFDVNKVSSGWVGYNSTNGVQLFSYKGGNKVLGIKDDGTPHFSGNILLHGLNYTNYTVKKDGTGATGTWGISITGSSSSCTGNAATATCIQKPNTNATELPTGTTICSDGVKFVRSVYNTVNRPATYGNVIQIGGSGHSQLFLEWSGSSATTGKVYYKSKRDVSTTEWGDWVQLIDERDVVTTSKAGLMSAADKTKLDGITGSVTNNLVIKLNSGATEGTNLFTFNGSAAKTINITPASINALASNGTASAAIRLSSKGDNTNANTLCFYSASISSTTLSAMNNWTRPTDGSNNAMVLRMYKTANTGHDIYAASDKDSLWHRNSSNATSKWAKILDSLNCYGIYNITINRNNISIEHISGKQLIPNINAIPIQGANRAYYAWTADETPASYDELVFLIQPKAQVLSGGGFYYYNLTAVVNQYGIYIICDSNDPSGLKGYASDNVPCRTIIFHL